MRKHLKNYLIPHEGNDHKPHFLREANIAVLTLIIVVFFLTSLFHVSLLVSDSDFIASVLPSVLVDLTNEEREDFGYGDLRINPVLEEAARQKAEDMAERGYFAHNTPDGQTPWHFFYSAGYDFTHAGENLAVNFADSDEVVGAWMDSPGHRANILNGDFTEIGIATARGEYEGRDTVFVVQLFGRPLSSVQGAATTQTTVDSEEEPQEESTQLVVSSEGPMVEEGDVIEEDGSVARSEIEEIEVTDVVESNDSLYIAVRDTSVSEESIVEDEQEGDEVSTSSEDTATTVVPATVSGGGGENLRYSSFWERLFASPNTILNTVYILLGLLIVVSLIISIIQEAHKHHKIGVAYGVLILVLIVGLTYLNKAIIVSSLAIV